MHLSLLLNIHLYRSDFMCSLCTCCFDIRSDCKYVIYICWGGGSCPVSRLICTWCIILPILGVGHVVSTTAASTLALNTTPHMFDSAGLGQSQRPPSFPSTFTRRDPAALLIFHRHGDRSPLRGHTPDEELALPTAARCNTSSFTGVMPLV